MSNIGPAGLPPIVPIVPIVPAHARTHIGPGGEQRFIGPGGEQRFIGPGGDMIPTKTHSSLSKDINSQFEHYYFNTQYSRGSTATIDDCMSAAQTLKDCVVDRKQSFEEACKDNGWPPRQSADRVGDGAGYKDLHEATIAVLDRLSAQPNDPSDIDTLASCGHAIQLMLNNVKA